LQARKEDLSKRLDGKKITSYQFITNFETGDFVNNTPLTAISLRKKGCK